jgi:hypothetical protein
MWPVSDLRPPAAWALAVGPAPAFIVMLLAFGWMVVIVSATATELRLKLPIIVLAGVAFAFEGIEIYQHSRWGPPPMGLDNVQLKSYAMDFAAQMRRTELPYRNELEEINLRTGDPAPSRGNAGQAQTRDESDKLLVEETEAFRAKHLSQGKLLQAELLKRLGPKYPEALYHGDGRRASIEASKLMLVDGTLVGADPLSNIAGYLEDLANELR